MDLAWAACGVTNALGKRSVRRYMHVDISCAYVYNIRSTTYPSPKLTLTLTSHSGQNDGSGEE